MLLRQPSKHTQPERCVLQERRLLHPYHTKQVTDAETNTYSRATHCCLFDVSISLSLVEKRRTKKFQTPSKSVSADPLRYWAAQLMSANFRCIFRPTLESSFLTNDGISTNSDHIGRSSNIEETEQSRRLSILCFLSVLLG